jgi:hypothetical protein
LSKINADKRSCARLRYLARKPRFFNGFQFVTGDPEPVPIVKSWQLGKLPATRDGRNSPEMQEGVTMDRIVTACH